MTNHLLSPVLLRRSMRWPLRSQIMLPMAATMLLAVVVVGGWSAVLAVRDVRSRIGLQISQVARILEGSNFPLTDAVLRQMEGLSGASLVLVESTGRKLASNDNVRQLPVAEFAVASPETPSATGPQHVERFRLDGEGWRRSHGYFHTSLNLASRRGTPSRDMLTILYPEAEYRRAWQRAIVPPLAFILLAMPVVMGLSALTASRISRRVSRLKTQVGRIAQGDFNEIALSERDDELRALGQAVNRMAAMLARYETEVRQTERMRTLAQLGGGIAHQLRNSATGCRIAIDLHAEACAQGRDESLLVAHRQLQLMEDYIQRILQLGRPVARDAASDVDLVKLIDELLPLIDPVARHARVTLRKNLALDAAVIVGDASRLRLLIVNLLLNAIEAAGERAANPHCEAAVDVAVAADDADRFVLEIIDTGPGPAPAVQETMFEPFISQKRDGVGLGLSVARDVARDHGGRIDWSRHDGHTCFRVRLPRSGPSQLHSQSTAPTAARPSPEVVGV